MLHAFGALGLPLGFRNDSKANGSIDHWGTYSEICANMTEGPLAAETVAAVLVYDVYIWMCVYTCMYACVYIYILDRYSHINCCLYCYVKGLCSSASGYMLVMRDGIKLEPVLSSSHACSSVGRHASLHACRCTYALPAGGVHTFV